MDTAHVDVVAIVGMLIVAALYCYLAWDTLHRAWPVQWRILVLCANLFVVGMCAWMIVVELRPRDTGAVCTTDADCAAWEVRHHVAEADRCYGAPCQQ